ncbi:META domain-containing protein [Neisseria chenwenguii]|nr:META domain-containing protein [Neisseria chenwenguii]
MRTLSPLLIVFTLAACTAPAKQPSTPPDPIANGAEPAHAAVKAQWRLTAIDGKPLPAAARYYLDLSELPRARAKIGCNNTYFNARIARNTLNIGTMTSTLMACTDKLSNQLESAFAQAVQEQKVPYRLQQQSKTLILNAPNGSVWTFERF